MTEMKTDLTAEQSDYAIFTPALSTFYALFVGRQRHDPNYVPQSRLPQHFTNNIESGNWLDPKGLWQYKWTLHSAGHATLDLDDVPREDMYRVRDKNTSWLLGDSGGFQIGKGKWEGDWKDPDCPKAKKKREGVLKWMDAFMDYGMCLDIPAWVSRSPAGQKATGITSYQEAVNGTRVNNDFWVRNRNGNCKFLNVLQGENHTDADDWYEQMKDFCDPKKFPDAHFNGWAMGGQNMCDIHLILKRLVMLHFDGLLEEGVQDWMHFLGTSKLEWACLLTDIQRAVRKNYNPKFTITYDCASPFLCSVNGQIYTHWRLDDRSKWSYVMKDALDDKSLASSTRPFDELCAETFASWNPSPLTAGMRVNEFCYYKPGDVNKQNREPTTSWDSFSYFLMMNHNVYTHIRSVQEANRAYDNGNFPKMLIVEEIDRIEVRDVINRVFEIENRDEALQFIDDNYKLWMKVIGTRGLVGKKSFNATGKFGELFEIG